MDTTEFIGKIQELNEKHDLQHTPVIVVDSDGFVFDDFEISFNQDDVPCLQIQVK